MNKVPVFSHAGGGKSTLSQRLAEVTGLPVEEYKAAHDRILQQDGWIIEGYGSLDTVWERLEVADTLIYRLMVENLCCWGWALNPRFLGKNRRSLTLQRNPP